jgi:hypothetical protein
MGTNRRRYLFLEVDKRHRFLGEEPNCVWAMIELQSPSLSVIQVRQATDNVHRALTNKRL